MKLFRFGKPVLGTLSTLSSWRGLPRVVTLVRPPATAPLGLRLLAAIGPRAVLAVAAAFALLVIAATPAGS